MEIARKITVGTINGVRKGFKGIKEVTLVARIFGIASEAKQEDGALGAYWKFTGEFKAVNQDGEETMAPVLMLPAPADGMLASAVNQSGAPVKFGFDIYVEPREDVAIGYSYKIKPLLEVKPSNPLADLMGELPALSLTPKAQGNLALEAPKGEAPASEAPETPKDEAPTKPAKPAGKQK